MFAVISRSVHWDEEEGEGNETHSDDFDDTDDTEDSDFAIDPQNMSTRRCRLYKAGAILSITLAALVLCLGLAHSLPSRVKPVSLSKSNSGPPPEDAKHAQLGSVPLEPMVTARALLESSEMTEVIVDNLIASHSGRGAGFRNATRKLVSAVVVDVGKSIRKRFPQDAATLESVQLSGHEKEAILKAMAGKRDPRAQRLGRDVAAAVRDCASDLAGTQACVGLRLAPRMREIQQLRQELVPAPMRNKVWTESKWRRIRNSKKIQLLTHIGKWNLEVRVTHRRLFVDQITTAVQNHVTNAIGNIDIMDIFNDFTTFDLSKAATDASTWMMESLTSSDVGPFDEFSAWLDSKGLTSSKGENLLDELEQFDMFKGTVSEFRSFYDDMSTVYDNTAVQLESKVTEIEGAWDKLSVTETATCLGQAASDLTINGGIACVQNFGDAGMDVVRAMNPADIFTSTSEGGGGGAPKCFPGASRVEVLGRGSMAIQELRVGDRILVARGDELMHEPVLGFLHKTKPTMASESTFLSIEHSHGAIHASEAHLVFIVDDKGARTSKMAGALQPGDQILAVSRNLRSRSQMRLEASAVLAVRRNSSSESMLAPLTPSGTLVVDGVLASAYASAGTLHIPHGAIHALFFLVRACHFTGICESTQTYDATVNDSASAQEEQFHPFVEVLFNRLQLHRWLEAQS